MLHMLAHCEHGRQDVIKSLDAAGADVSIQDMNVRRWAIDIPAQQV